MAKKKPTEEKKIEVNGLEQGQTARHSEKAGFPFFYLRLRMVMIFLMGSHLEQRQSFREIPLRLSGRMKCERRRSVRLNGVRPEQD